MRRRHEVIGEVDGQGLASIIVEKFLEQRAAYSLREPAGELPFDEHRIDCPADVVSENITLDRHPAGLAIDLGHGDVHAIRVGHMIAEEPAIGGKAGWPLAEHLRCRLQRLGDLAQRDRGTIGTAAHHAATDDRERAGVLLHEFGGDLDRLGAHLRRGAPRRLSGHHRGAGREGPHPERNAVGAAVHDPHGSVVHAERIGANLCHHRLDALAERSRAGHHFHHARAIDRHPHAVERPEPALLHEKRKARANALADATPALEFILQIAPFGRRQRFVEQTGIIAGIQHDLGAESGQRAAVRHLVFADQVAPAHFDAIHRKPHRDRVHQALAHERAFKPSRRTIGATRRLVCEPHAPDGPIGRHAIGPGQHGGGKVRDRGRVGAHVAALIVEEFVIHREEAALGVDRRAHFVALLTGMIGGDQMLAPVLEPFHRPAESQRGETHQYVLGIKLAANSESAAHMAFDEMHARRATAEHAGDIVAVPVRHFGSAIELQQVAGGVVACDCAAGLQGNAGMASDGEIELDYDWGIAKRCRDVAIGFFHYGRLGRTAGLEFARRCARVEHDWEIFDLGRDELGGILRHIRVAGKHHGHRLADIAHALTR